MILIWPLGGVVWVSLVTHEGLGEWVSVLRPYKDEALGVVWGRD